MLKETKLRIEEYARGKKWFYYVPVWFAGVYLFVKLIGFHPEKQLPFPILIAQSFDFFLHEMAHIVTGFLPVLLTAAAGSFSELLLGTVLVVMAWKGRYYFVVLICALWFMLACQSVGVYMADARAQKLSLVSLGGALSGSDSAIHDWHFIFGKLHLLSLDTFIGGSVRGFGMLVGLTALIFSAYLIYKMAVLPDTQSQTDKDREMLKVLSAMPTAGTATNSIYPSATRGLRGGPEPEPTESKDRL